MGSNQVSFRIPFNASVTITASAFSMNIQRVTIWKVDVAIGDSDLPSFSDPPSNAVSFLGSGEDVAMLLSDQSNQIDWASNLLLSSRTLFLVFEYSTGGDFQPDMNVQNPGPIIRPEGSKQPTFKQWTISGQSDSGNNNDATVTIVADNFIWSNDHKAGEDRANMDENAYDL